MNDQRDAIAFLSNPASYGPQVNNVERHETHGAYVFLAGERAYKLKRAVRYPYMDFSTPALRRAACEAELTVNRRTAPELYLETRALVRGGDGKVAFGTDADGAIDWVVVMQRFPQSALLEEMRKRGELTGALMDALAQAIAALHAKAEPAPSYGGAAQILRVIDENAAILRTLENHPFGHAHIAHYEALSRDAFARLSALLDERRASGFVRRCHGDLHLNNICLIGGKPVLFDAIEFNEDFSCIDTFYDLAFLLMDLEHHRLRELANILLNRYAALTGDYGGIAALPLFLACRAGVRAHVIATQARQQPIAFETLARDAASFLDDANAFLEDAPSHLIVLAGLSGTGKSTLARAIAPGIGAAPGAVVLRSDVIRKHFWGVEETARLPQEAYSADVTARVYARIAELAGMLLKAGHSVIADAVYGRPEERARIEAAAESAHARTHPFWLEAPHDILERRIAARTDDASDATVAILHMQQKTIAPPAAWTKIDVSGTADESLTRLRAALG